MCVCVCGGGGGGGGWKGMFNSIQRSEKILHILARDSDVNMRLRLIYMYLVTWPHYKVI